MSALGEASIRVSGGWLPGKRSSDYFPTDGDHVDEHQVEMLQALKNGESCILNANPTGGGKTRSWAAPVIRRDLEGTPNLVMATYPTTALLKDQRRTILGLLKDYFDAEESARSTSFELKDDSTRLSPVLTDGQQIFELSELVQTVSVTADPTTSSTIQIDNAMRVLRSLDAQGLPGIVLTTPDTLTLLATNRFQSGDVGRLIPMLDAIVVDEFHLATDRARRLLPFHLDHYRTLSPRYLESFVFLSATPHPSYVERLERVFDPVSVTNTVLSDPQPSGSSRKILPETRLHLTSRDRFTNGHWLADNVEQLAAAYKPPGQLLIVVDSVHEVELVTEALDTRTELSVGRVYGWKREGRQETIHSSDVVVGNTAVEVGVDFQRVNRLVCTGYEPASILQRIGRMRYRSQFDDYEALLVTSPRIHSSILANTGQDEVSRTDLDEALHDPVEVTERPYYDVLCGAYTRFLWDGAENPLSEEYAGKEESYRRIAANHFAKNFAAFFDSDEDVESFWSRAREFGRIEQMQAVFEELHTYRSSSLTCIVVDVNDPEERLKRYNLSHVLRHRKGKVIGLDDVETVFREVFGESFDSSERALLDRSRSFAVAAFLSRGRREDTRDFYIQDFHGLEELVRQASDNGTPRALGTLPYPSVKTNPLVAGTDKIDLNDEDILAQYVPHDPETARQRYSLGPYASVVGTPRDGCLILWGDAIKAHCWLVERL